ncbi:transglycosylase domain-containing protein [Sediminibacillus albus]|uniref:Penicillin-binding protein 2A n=1 Tax=Sediminibacillus albus TaxID=407036 RepID=A0A1G8XD25_9BACI|nr:PBP1A family penicillin-binding protein [Sediminibacillus albus]SDJ88383.1 penicillin-binding protein 2A [Sediminibacillus albus]
MEPKQLFVWINRLKWPLVVIGAIVLLGLLGYLTILFGGRFVVDEEDLVLPAATIVETTDGSEIGKIYDEYRLPVLIEEVPEHVENAFLAIEDHRFYDHAGVDFKSVSRAVFRDIATMEKAEGGSTITQQLAKNLFLHNEKTWMRKTKEVMAAIYLERNFSKKKILEYYLNEIYFAHGVYGVGAAAEFYFSKSVDELSITEGALLAALSKAPNTYSPLIDPDKAKDRRDLVLQQMSQFNMLETEEMLQLQGKTLGVDQKNEEEVPWFDSYVDLAIKEAEEKYQLSLAELKRGGYRIVVNVDETAQQIAYEKFQEAENFPESLPGAQGAFVLMDHKTGEIAAAIGGRDFQAGDLNRLLLPKQPGSTIKPIAVYGPAMMLDKYQPYSLLVDKKQSYGDYTATNYDDSYQGEVSMYEAIMRSKNAPAVWLLDEIGISYSKRYLKKMGIDLSDQGLAIALGGLEEGISPLKLGEAYSSFANQGKMATGYTIDRIHDRSDAVAYQAEPENIEVFSAQTAWNMVRMLERAVAGGTAAPGEYAGALAGKTGSTQHPFAEGQVKDAWFAGFTPQYATVLWMGYDQVDEEHYLTKGSESPTILAKAILADWSKEQDLGNEFEQPKHVKDVEKPIELPVISDLKAEFNLGGFSLIRGKLSWTASPDDRVVYQIYRVSGGQDQKIGEVKGKGQYQIKRASLFRDTTYYVVPYNPLTNRKGNASNHAKLSLDF